MRKHFKLAAIAAFMALLMAVVSPMQAFAASQKLYVSDIRMSDSAEKLESLGYKVLDNDLNAGGNNGFTYIGYKTTADANEAITDISVMDMKGGYSFSDYEEMLKRQKDTIQQQEEIYRVAVGEFRECYNEGSESALLVYEALNRYVEDDSGKKIGDLFVNPALSDDDLIKIMMEGSFLVNTTITETLAFTLAHGKGESWLNRIPKNGSVSEDYYDEALSLMSAAEEVRTTLQEYKSFNVSIEDTKAVEAFTADATSDEIMRYNECATLYALLHSHEYKDGTLADLFMNDDLSYEDLYPIIAALTPGQLAVAKLNGFISLIQYADVTSEMWKQAKSEYTKKESNESVSIYTGVDRSFYRGGVALTSDAKRKAASTGDNSWYYGNVNNTVEISLLATGAVSSLVLIGSVASLLAAKAAVSSGWQASLTAVNAVIKAQNMLDPYAAQFFGDRARQSSAYWASAISSAEWVATVATVVMYVSLAIMIIVFGVYLTIELTNYYHPEYTEIPSILLDLKNGESDEIGDWEKYVRYDVVLNEKDESGDLNAFSAKQWNAMYTTKDKAAGNPITADSLLAKYGNSATPRGYSPVHYFGSTDAFDLNSHCYNNDVDGIFMFFQRDEKAFAADTASVFGSGALSVVTGFGGLIIGALGAVLFTRKKKVAAAEI